MPDRANASATRIKASAASAPNETVSSGSPRDSSYAIFYADGGLVANAPHIPVHLGAMGASVRAVLDAHPTLAPGEDRFWVLDAFVGYRLPNRRGLLSLTADNLLDESFQFQDVDPTNPSLFPERLISFRFTLAFE